MAQLYVMKDGMEFHAKAKFVQISVTIVVSALKEIASAHKAGQETHVTFEHVQINALTTENAKTDYVHVKQVSQVTTVQNVS
jgi:hypothetical protein